MDKDMYVKVFRRSKKRAIIEIIGVTRYLGHSLCRKDSIPKTVLVLAGHQKEADAEVDPTKETWRITPT